MFRISVTWFIFNLQRREIFSGKNNAASNTCVLKIIVIETKKLNPLTWSSGTSCKDANLNPFSRSHALDQLNHFSAHSVLAQH